MAHEIIKRFILLKSVKQYFLQADLEVDLKRVKWRRNAVFGAGNV